MIIQIEIVGYIAAVLTTSAFIPQVLKTYRSKSAKDLSLGMFTIFVLGLLLWLVYGIVLKKYPIILANGITLVLAGILLFLKARYKD